MRGITLESSSSKLILSEPGLVDSPPISIMSAPSFNNYSAWIKALSLLRYFPPSEKESGVTFRIPIIIGFLSFFIL